MNWFGWVFAVVVAFILVFGIVALVSSWREDMASNAKRH